MRTLLLRHPVNYSAKPPPAPPPFGAVKFKTPSPPADVEEKVVVVATASSDSASETTNTAVRVTRFDVAHYRYEDPLLILNQVNDSEIPLRESINGNVFSLVQTFRACGFGQAKARSSVKATVNTTCSEACDGALSSNSRVLEEAATVVLLDKTH